MRRLMFAVCALLLSPTTALACIDEHNVQGEWFYQPPSTWSHFGSLGETTERDRAMGASVILGSSGAIVLLGVMIRRAAGATRRSGRVEPEPASRVPLAIPFAPPELLTLRVDGAHQQSSPAAVTRARERKVSGDYSGGLAYRRRVMASSRG
jgi:hypothetical protein